MFNGVTSTRLVTENLIRNSNCYSIQRAEAEPITERNKLTCEAIFLCGFVYTGIFLVSCKLGGAF